MCVLMYVQIERVYQFDCYIELIVILGSFKLYGFVSGNITFVELYITKSS